MSEPAVEIRGPAYRVETERTLIRCWEPSDAPRLRALIDRCQAELRPWIPWMKDEPASLEHTAERLRRYRAAFDSDADYRYAVFSADGETLLGETGLYTRIGPEAREIGYITDTAQAGRGYAKETTRAMLRVAFEIDGAQRVEIHCAPDNRASARIPEALGFTLEATLARRSRDPDGREYDLQVWTLFRDDFAGSPAAGIGLRAFDCLGRRLI